MNNLFDIPEGIEIIEVRKQLSKMFAEARRAAKPNRCILCGKEKTSFCNSHSVPQLSLKSIADNGKLYLASALIGIDIVEIETGVNNAGTFHIICNKCDSEFFHDYENEENLSSKPSDKMLAEIAVKNILLAISKQYQIKELHKTWEQQGSFTNLDTLFSVDELDMRDYLEELKLNKANVDNAITGCYQILFWKLLPYKVPIATESAIALLYDMNGNTINSVFDLSNENRMQFMHLAILPLSDKSAVIAFYHKKDKLYKELWHQFNSSSEERCLQFLNYIIFAYTENYFISKSIKDEIENNEKLSLLCQEKNGFPAMGMLNSGNGFGVGYQPISETEIPNFLSSEWAI